MSDRDGLAQALCCGEMCQYRDNPDCCSAIAYLEDADRILAALPGLGWARMPEGFEPCDVCGFPVAKDIDACPHCG